MSVRKVRCSSCEAGDALGAGFKQTHAVKEEQTEHSKTFSNECDFFEFMFLSNCGCDHVVCEHD